LTLISDIQYFGNISYYKILTKSELILFDASLGFRKMSFLNRCRIAGANGPMWLTIPLEGGRDQKSRIKDIRIDNRQTWQRRHWRSICSSYNRSPWFIFYERELQPLFEKNYTFLVDCVVESHAWVVRHLGWKQEWRLQEVRDRDFTEAVDILNRSSGQDNQMKQPVPSYRQVFQETAGFFPNLSILDMLFCEGAQKTNQLLGKEG